MSKRYKHSLDLYSPIYSEDDNTIEIKNLYRFYGKVPAIKDISFAVKKGEIFGLIGPDGAGKTTILHILSGVIEASAGQVAILKKAPNDARLFIGYLTQKFSLYLDLSIEENLRYYSGLRQIPADLYQHRRIKYLSLMNLEKFANRLAGNLSGGMKQKLALCCALITQPPILLLDEPTTGVDPVSRREFWEILSTVAQEGISIVVATPYLDEAEHCHRIALMHEGEIQQIGSLFQLRESLGLTRLELRSANLKNLEIILTEMICSSSIVEVQAFGDRLDVLVKDAKKGEVEIREICLQQSIYIYDIYITNPTLENVFVNRLRYLKKEAPFIPFPFTNQRFSPKTQEIAIGAKGLTKTFGHFNAVRNVNLAIHYGQIYGLLGANGAGKTTTIKMLCGLLEASEGEVSLAGIRSNLRSKRIRQEIGYMSQKFTLYDDLSILENLEFYCGIYGVLPNLRRTKIDWVLNVCGLSGKEDVLTGLLPGGWKQRVAFGASIMHEPKILFLDEPTSGVDPLARRQFWRTINELADTGTAVLVTTHHIEEAEQCNHIAFMMAGKLVTQGTPSEIKASQPGKLMEIITDYPQKTLMLLRSHLDPWRISQFGKSLHLILQESSTEIPAIEMLLKNASITILNFRSISFSLEDVFINIVRER